MAYTYYWADGSASQQPYNQYTVNGCAIGCGSLAWTILFLWGDRQAGTGNSYWAPRWGLYRQDGGTGADVVSPTSQTAGVNNVIEEIADDVDTFCAFGQGATHPATMGQASRYFSGRTGTTLVEHHNIFGVSESRLREYARNSIRDRDTPAVIGTGWLSHYPVAYGYAWQSRIVRKCFIFCWNETVYDRWFWVNQGWGGSGNDWVPADTWFAGEIYP
ncbi:hypothetical protein [uncultured Tateyamaria sp.]|uniref:hypothetical protein n=1 Tax=uncultured Tateyamaria sp. TaxID=455651 RepID=UPI002621C287|nr:hypothetical protein [uncultured Tateyamaria sp.]